VYDILTCAVLCYRYGDRLSKEQVAQLVSPHQDTLELVHSWLGNHTISSSSISMTHGGSWLTLSAVPVAQANELLGASYQLCRQTGTNDTAILRTIGYSLPTVLHAHVQTVIPTTYFSPRPLWQTPQKRTVNATLDMAEREPGRVLSKRDDDSDIRPLASHLRSLYRMEAYVPNATNRNILGVAGFANQYPSPTDFITFMTECRSDAVHPVFTFVQVNDGEYDPDDEANTNIQYTEADVPDPDHLLQQRGKCTV
jgi:tripeptidyl-peptidase-1